MKAIRTLMLVLALSVCAYADGNMPNDKNGNIPYDRTGYMPNGGTGDLDNGKDGEIPCDKTGIMPNDLVTATALQVLHNILPLF